MGTCLSPNIDKSRLSASSLLTTARKLNLGDDTMNPSLLSPSHHDSRLNDSCHSIIRKPNIQVKKKKRYEGARDILLKNNSWLPLCNGPSPVLVFLVVGRKRKRGWLRRQEAQNNNVSVPFLESHLDPNEKKITF